MHFRIYEGYGRAPSLLEMALSALLGVALGVAFVAFRAHFGFNQTPSGPVISVQAKPKPDSGPFGNMLGFLPRLDHRLNILFMGVDSNGRGTDRFANTRSDTMMLMSVDPVSNRVGLVSIPRDSRVTIAGHSEDKINAAHAYGGPALAQATVENALGVHIDHYVVADLAGIKRLFEIIGPVDVLVEKRMCYTDHAGGLFVDLQPGYQRLTPIQIEEYLRFRHDATSNLGRIQRQQWFLREVALGTLRDPQIYLKLPDLFQAAKDYVVTDLNPQEMAQLAAFAKDLKPNQIEAATLPGRSATINGGSYWLVDFDATKLLLARVAGQPVSSTVTSDLLVPAENLVSSNRQLTISIRYPKGSESAANSLEAWAVKHGLTVSAKIRAELSGCQHEQILEHKLAYSDSSLMKLRGLIPCIADWPATVDIAAESGPDFTLVVSPETSIPLAEISAEQHPKSFD